MGDPEEGEVELAPVKQISASKVDMMGPIPYTALQALADPLNPPHLNNHWKNQFMDDLKDETVEAVRKYFLTSTSPISELHFEYVGKGVSEVSEEENTFGHRKAKWIVNIVVKWDDPRHTEANVS
ncbi:hypothetical protein HS1genome_1587 [Sulfodiicoccus acidiphilus]|uniref:Uncharacterized protein n=2 Tax=Sulfodiicoccus acidiphilus TaxID=1670455 RepID=A0A348B4U6_9CREN|nr:hypothetical protein HS1genome_1587 [Sulfodiicoccus acidiphilus]GGU01442.1 hypothetical protein GCM10007116_18320 [Sulfodiicoccus acidiphilus]